MLIALWAAVAQFSRLSNSKGSYLTERFSLTCLGAARGTQDGQAAC